MTIHQFPAIPPILESTAVLTLREAGYEAFVNDGDATSLKGGVCVRIRKYDARIQWTGKDETLAPMGHLFSLEETGRYVLHAGRTEEFGGAERLSGFVTNLVATQSVGRELQAA